MQKVCINPPHIKLEQFLKLCALVNSGGEAKVLIQGGKVAVNGEICPMRGKKLFGGEVITIENQHFEVAVK